MPTKLVQRLRLALSSLALCAAGAALVPSPAAACMHGVPSPRQDAMIFWNDGVEVLVWRATIEPPAADHDAARPHPLAWVLAVPSAPIAFHALDAAQFTAAMHWSENQVVADGAIGEGGYGSRGLRGGGGLAVGPTQQVGDYQITPLQGTGAGAVTALRAWLTSNHFGTPAEPALRAYAQQGYTFLAVRSTLPAHTPSAQLQPLAIAFRSPTITLPIRMSGGAPPFALNAAIYSGRVPVIPAGGLTQGLSARQMHAVGSAMGQQSPGNVALIPWVSFPESMRVVVRPLVAQVPQLAALLRGPVAAAYLSGAALNVDPAQPDPSLALGEPVPASVGSAPPEQPAAR